MSVWPVRHLDSRNRKIVLEAVAVGILRVRLKTRIRAVKPSYFRTCGDLNVTYATRHTLGKLRVEFAYR